MAHKKKEHMMKEHAKHEEKHDGKHKVAVKHKTAAHKKK